VASLSFSKFNPSFTANYHWSDDISSYAKVSTGYRSGGIYAPAAIGQFSRALFQPETLTSYEVGMKSDWLDRRLRVNVAIFDAKYKDMQVAYKPDALNPANTLIVNAGRATIKGVELEVLANVLENLNLNLSYTYLDAKLDSVAVLPGSVFDRAANPASPYGVGDNIADLFSMPRSPKNAVAAGVDYEFLHLDNKQFSARLDYRWTGADFQNGSVGSAFANADIYGKRPSFGTLDGRLTMAMELPHGDHAKVSLWGKNLTDKDYWLTLNTFNRGTFPAAGGFYQPSIAWAPPRSYGISLGYEF